MWTFVPSVWDRDNKHLPPLVILSWPDSIWWNVDHIVIVLFFIHVYYNYICLFCSISECCCQRSHSCLLLLFGKVLHISLPVLKPCKLTLWRLVSSGRRQNWFFWFPWLVFHLSWLFHPASQSMAYLARIQRRRKKLWLFQRNADFLQVWPSDFPRGVIWRACYCMSHAPVCVCVVDCAFFCTYIL